MEIEEKHIRSLYLQFMQGSEEAFSDLYCRLFDVLIHYGCRIGGSKEIAEDAIQDIFLKLYQKRILLKDDSRLRAFLFRAVKNYIYNRLIHDSRSTSLEESGLEFSLSYTVNDSLAGEDKNTLSEEVENLLKSLTERQKEIIYLRFVHEMSYEEIAEIMEMNIQSARNLIARSKQKLKDKGSNTFFFFLM